jgi:hypothetical protein
MLPSLKPMLQNLETIGKYQFFFIINSSFWNGDMRVDGTTAHTRKVDKITLENVCFKEQIFF